MKEELMKEFGLQVDTYANKIIKNKKNKEQVNINMTVTKLY